MKQKLSITMDGQTVQSILKTVATGKFRNKSHVVEYAVKKLLENYQFKNKNQKENDKQLASSQSKLEVQNG
jgi:Arc/MetJ-type ribon-helix-helix transcriptional regulator